MQDWGRARGKEKFPDKVGGMSKPRKPGQPHQKGTKTGQWQETTSCKSSGFLSEFGAGTVLG